MRLSRVGFDRQRDRLGRTLVILFEDGGATSEFQTKNPRLHVAAAKAYLDGNKGMVSTSAGSLPPRRAAGIAAVPPYGGDPASIKLNLCACPAH
jgi:hypothetical protein